MNYALIFAGGTGQRMNSKSLPKQFLSVHGKPIIIHTILNFENSRDIKGIVVVCYAPYIKKFNSLLKQYNIKKVVGVVPGGENGQQSIYFGLRYLSQIAKGDDIVLIHDGVRPLINKQIIRDNIACVKENGTAITVSNAIETVIVVDNDKTVDSVMDRKKCFYAKAPQSFFFKDIYESHLKAIQENRLDFIDSAMLMEYYGYKLYTVVGATENIKITTQVDFFMFKGLLDAREINQVKVIK
jgi:2-C-methyl-D-erythritol 4-phosphate cytidylyltransferase